jgi:hypothetical protein
MKKICLLYLSIIFFSCNNKSNVPDVSDIKVDVTLDRFEKTLFSLDTVGLEKGLRTLEVKYPSFLPVFLGGVLGLPDSEEIREQELKKFLRLNRQIYDSVNLQYKDFNKIKNQIENSFRFVKYYFPTYKLPNIITLVGPIDAMAQMQSGEYTPDFLGQGFLAISLQFYLGKNFSIYQEQYFIDNVAPLYRSRRFDREYITADAMKLIVDDLFPDRSKGQSLVEQMIEKGKHWWLLDKFMPATADSLKTGYTQDQLNWCKENEGQVWNAIIDFAGDLYTKDPAAVQNYIGEAPTTQGMPGASPGNIGPWVGWQIVKKFVEKNSSLKPADVMSTPARKILDEAKYKPK